MPPKSEIKPVKPNKAEQQFWEKLVAVGTEILEQGKTMGFAMSLVEIKFMHGEPTVIIRSISQNLLYGSDQDAQIGIAKELEMSKKAKFTGARTFTLVMNEGDISKIVIDEYHTQLLSSK